VLCCRASKTPHITYEPEYQAICRCTFERVSRRDIHSGRAVLIGVCRTAGFKLQLAVCCMIIIAIADLRTVAARHGVTGVLFTGVVFGRSDHCAADTITRTT